MSLQSVAYLSPKDEMEYSEGKHGTREIWVTLVKPLQLYDLNTLYDESTSNLFLFWF